MLSLFSIFMLGYVFESLVFVAKKVLLYKCFCDSSSHAFLNFRERGETFSDSVETFPNVANFWREKLPHSRAYFPAIEKKAGN